jgi:uncharacterized protein (DUF885 family)
MLFHMIKRTTTYPSTILILLLCRDAFAQQPKQAEGEYRQLADAVVASHLAWNPGRAVELGFHEFDGKVIDLGRKSIDRRREQLHAFHAELAALAGHGLSARSDLQRRMLLSAVDRELLDFDVKKSYTRNPMAYAGAIDVDLYAKRDFAPKPQRLRAVIEALGHMSDVMKAARANLDPVLPKPFVDTAIQIAEGAAEFQEHELVDAFSDVDNPPLQAEFQSAVKASAEEFRRFVEYLKTEKLPKADESFAIGQDGFKQMLAGTELISQSPEQILEIGMRELHKEQEIFAKTAARIDSSKPPIEVFKAIQNDHPTADSLIPDVRAHLERIRSFIVEKDLITIPSEVRVKVEETPRFDRAMSFASMDSPGPFETKATQAYYYVTPVESEWDAKRKDEWLTAFNFYTTDVVSIHEAYPGHYVQFLQLQASNADRIDKIFGSYAFIEGWAHYCEQMTIDEGYGAKDGPLAAAKYRLAQSDEALLRVCRLCVAIKMHTQGMTVDEATKFFMENCYYEEAPARSEAQRGTHDPGYCFYTIGKLEFLKLRNDFRKQEGSSFSLRRFHNEVLQHGAPPIRLLRDTMLKESALQDQAL